ncbi:hypothetical protein JMA_20410 [Jeotgalibacillus malaysiensis]|uniref:Uncharacterized protein n=1 Tax=Jeotgalibacillus malaysiensis TaxID=1508404 RepID=A0A0B5AS25_9BACL|nr:hypothetical protein [Jeotgalibacillus malaysiensis]AJD91358.1 hypothetical protein JMA_20410 [Jeotgalibacillus malaysiensis]
MIPAYLVLGAESLILAGLIWKGIGARQPFVYTVKSTGVTYLMLLGSITIVAGLAGVIEYYIPSFLIRIFIT